MRIQNRDPASTASAQLVEDEVQPPTVRLGNGVLYVGMNSAGNQAELEAALLRRHGPGVRTTIAHGERDPEVGRDHVRLGDGRVVDLSTQEGAMTLAESLDLPPSQTERIADIVFGALDGSRDELAAMAVVFAEAERGGDCPSRLVLSGHSTGAAIYDGAGSFGALRFTDVLALGAAMPRAAAQIEDIMISACASGFDVSEASGGVALSAWRDHFPSLKTVWGYGGEREFHSPTGRTALEHIEAWEIATRGRNEELHARSALQVASGGRPVGYERAVSVWSESQGYVRGK